MSIDTVLKAPFPAFGGKGRVASLVWERLGDVNNFIEPFCFSAAVLLRRPTEAKIETINDSNHFVANFWRATTANPDAVAHAADWPVNEADIHARHRWLVQSEEALAIASKVRSDPEFFDAKVAGWWAWGACCWIGSGWCEIPEWEGRANAAGNSRGVNKLCQQMPEVGQSKTGGRGVHGSGPSHHQKRPRAPSSVGGSMPGIITMTDTHRPQLADAYSRGRGVHGNDRAEACEDRSDWLKGWFRQLRDRLRVVRVCCGDWIRVCDSPSVTTRLGLTGIFLDAPYRKKLADGSNNRTKAIYANDRTQDVEAIVDNVIAYCLERGSDPKIRIAACCLEGEGYEVLSQSGWSVSEWKSSGYQNRSKDGAEKSARERIWFSPHCLEPESDRYPLFDRDLG